MMDELWDGVIALGYKALVNKIPVFISGEPGTEKSKLANAIANEFSTDEKIINVIPGSYRYRETREIIEGMFSSSSPIEDRVIIFHNLDLRKSFFGNNFIEDLLSHYESEASKGNYLSPRLITTSMDSIDDLQTRNELNYFYYNNVVGVRFELPPLREQSHRIIELAGKFLKKIGNSDRKHPIGFSPDAQKALKAYHWPGNVAELKQVIQHAFVMSTGDFIEVKDLPQHIIEPKKRVKTSEPLSSRFDLNDEIRQITRGYIEKALREANGKKSMAARMLGLKSQQALNSKMKAAGMVEG